MNNLKKISTKELQDELNRRQEEERIALEEKRHLAYMARIARLERLTIDMVDVLCGPHRFTDCSDENRQGVWVDPHDRCTRCVLMDVLDNPHSLPDNTDIVATLVEV